MTDRYQDDYERARLAAPYSDDQVVDRNTRQLMAAGTIIFQSHMLAFTDREHCRRLLRLFRPPIGASVLDVGCGIGAVAAHMAEQGHGLRFTLFNISPAQLRLAPIRMRKVVGHMHELPFADRSFDAVMFCFSLGHGRVDRSLAEAARVVRPGGVVFAWELSTDRPAELAGRLGYRPHRWTEVLRAAADAGLDRDLIGMPRSTSSSFIRLVGREAFAEHGFDQCRAIAYRFTRP